jgi:hypothetical protein
MKLSGASSSQATSAMQPSRIPDFAHSNGLYMQAKRPAEERRDMFWGRYVGDRKSRRLAGHLKDQAQFVREPQLNRIVERLAASVFVSHTSKDHEGIRNQLLPVVNEFLPDPFFHSFVTGGAAEYEKVIGLALLSSRRVLAVWSPNAAASDYFLAEQYLAFQEGKSVVAFCLPGGDSLAGKLLGRERVLKQRHVIVAGSDMSNALRELRDLLAEW